MPWRMGCDSEHTSGSRPARIAQGPLSLDFDPTLSRNLKVPSSRRPSRPSKSRGAPTVSPGLTIRACPIGVLGVVLSALHAGAFRHTIQLYFPIWEIYFFGPPDSVWSMLQDLSLRKLSFTRGLRLATVTHRKSFRRGQRANPASLRARRPYPFS